MSGAADQLELCASAIAVAASGLRHQLAAWLRQRGIDTAHANDILLVVYEALANCVDHAYTGGPTGNMIVQAAYDPDAQSVSVCVIDHGTWSPPSGSPRRGHRGRGIRLMNAMADRCTINGRPDGTTVWMDWSLNTAGPPAV